MSLYRSLVTTADGRLTEGKTYVGRKVWVWFGLGGPGWRIKLERDDLGKQMTFNPKVFRLVAW